MKQEIKGVPGFNDIVFDIRNKQYGAYVLRKDYNRNIMISLFTGIIIMSVSVIIPHLRAKAMENSKATEERLVTMVMENMEQPAEQVAPPPPPPPPAEVSQPNRYIPPVVVDTIRPEDQVQLMTADQASVEIVNEEYVEPVEEVKEEVMETEAEPEPFVVVEEMPEFPGGQVGLLKYIADNTRYPDIARENNIQGRVFVQFCVTSKGTIDKVRVSKSVDPELDAEAVRVVKSLPAFTPGKQGGKPVPVLYSVPILFQLN